MLWILLIKIYTAKAYSNLGRIDGVMYISTDQSIFDYFEKDSNNGLYYFQEAGDLPQGRKFVNIIKFPECMIAFPNERNCMFITYASGRVWIRTWIQLI